MKKTIMIACALMFIVSVAGADQNYDNMNAPTKNSMQPSLLLTYDGSNFYIVNGTSKGHLKVQSQEFGTQRSVLSKNAVAVTTAYMMIDVDNSLGNMPSAQTTGTYADIYHLGVDTNGENTFIGDLFIGFISNSNAANATLNVIKANHMELSGAGATKLPPDVHSHLHFHPNAISCKTADLVGPTIISHLFNSGAALSGPDNGSVYYPADGDIIAYLTVTTDTTDISVALGYDVH